MTDQINPTDINAEAIAKARERQAQRRQTFTRQPDPKPTKQEQMSARAAAIQAATQKVAPKNRVRLHALSAYTDLGQPIEVECRRLTLQELVAADLLPMNASRIVDRLIIRGAEATEAERKRRGSDPAVHIQFDVTQEVNDAIEEEFGAVNTAALDALYGLVNAVCVAAVIDPEMHLYFKADDAARDQFGVHVETLPEEDRFEIFNWAMTTEEQAVRSIEPFRHPAVDDGAVSADETRPHTTERADSV